MRPPPGLDGEQPAGTVRPRTGKDDAHSQLAKLFGHGLEHLVDGRLRRYLRGRATQFETPLGERHVVACGHNINHARLGQHTIPDVLHRQTGFPPKDLGHQAPVCRRHVLRNHIHTGQACRERGYKGSQGIKPPGRRPYPHHVARSYFGCAYLCPADLFIHCTPFSILSALWR